MDISLDKECTNAILLAFISATAKNQQKRHVRPVHAKRILDPFFKQYDRPVVLRCYVFLLENKYLELRDNVDGVPDKNRFVAKKPDFQQYTRHHVSRVTEKGYQYLNDQLSHHGKHSVKELLKAGANLAAILSTIAPALGFVSEKVIPLLTTLM